MMKLKTVSIILLIFYTIKYTSSECIIPPQDCPNKHVTFWLYTRSQQGEPYQLMYENETSLQRAPLKYDAPLIVLIHGYTGHKDYDPNPQIRPAYLERSEYNVISVDWHPLAKDPCYLTAVRNVPLAGKCTAKMLDALVKIRKFPLKSIHVIGFSLGAHAAGAVGKNIKSGKLERITGLDPALPLFVTDMLNKKLDKSDAKFVDVMHTNALNRGKLEPLGHVDFYVNGGATQPGCENENKNAESSCSHARATYYYGESLNTKTGFYGKECESYFKYMLNACGFDKKNEEMIMGFDTPTIAKGLYFVNTNRQSPFARGSTRDKKSNGTS